MRATCDADSDITEDENSNMMALQIYHEIPAEPPKDDGLSAGIIAAIVISCIVGVAIIAFCIYWFAIRKPKVETS